MVNNYAQKWYLCVPLEVWQLPLWLATMLFATMNGMMLLFLK
jgi:hypothetical protein